MTSKTKQIAIFGAGGFGREVAELIIQINNYRREWNLIGFFDDDEASREKSINGYSILGGIKELNSWDGDIYIVLALGMPDIKKKTFAKIKNHRVKYPVLIHPSTIMGNRNYINIGEGSIICAGNIITTNVNVGRHVILNLACTLGHDVSIGEFSSLMPTCNVSGEVQVGDSVFFGTGSKIINRIKVGNNCIIGAGAVVISDLPDNITAVGVPAKAIKCRTL